MEMEEQTLMDVKWTTMDVDCASQQRTEADGR
jgi:hypothetical protein